MVLPFSNGVSFATMFLLWRSSTLRYSLQAGMARASGDLSPGCSVSRPTQSWTIKERCYLRPSFCWQKRSNVTSVVTLQVRWQSWGISAFLLSSFLPFLFCLLIPHFNWSSFPCSFSDKHPHAILSTVILQPCGSTAVPVRDAFPLGQCHWWAKHIVLVGCDWYMGWSVGSMSPGVSSGYFKIAFQFWD